MTTTKEIMCPKCQAPAGKPCVSLASGNPLPDMHRDRQSTPSLTPEFRAKTAPTTEAKQ
jgi:hypothetical protein